MSRLTAVAEKESLTAARVAGVVMGDPHNFGRVVRLNPNRQSVNKPRTVLWEWLLLDPNSPLRQFVGQLSTTRSEWASLQLPSIHYEPGSSGSLSTDGDASFIMVTPATIPDVSTEDFANIGWMLGFIAALGVSDLHERNLLFGLTADEKLTLVPVDIECPFHTYDMLHQPLLIETAQTGSETIAGLRAIRAYCREYAHHEAIAALCWGYMAALDLAAQYGVQLHEVCSHLLGFLHAPIRILLRDTREYYRWLQGADGGTFSPAMIPAELSQLQRRDVPYFFQTVESPGAAQYFSDARYGRDIVPAADLRHFRLPEINTNILCDRARLRRLQKYGGLQLARYFDVFTTATVSHRNVRIRYADNVCVEYSTGETGFHVAADRWGPT